MTEYISFLQFPRYYEWAAGSYIDINVFIKQSGPFRIPGPWIRKRPVHFSLHNFKARFEMEESHSASCKYITKEWRTGFSEANIDSSDRRGRSFILYVHRATPRNGKYEHRGNFFFQKWVNFSPRPKLSAENLHPSFPQEKSSPLSRSLLSRPRPFAPLSLTLTGNELADTHKNNLFFPSWLSNTACMGVRTQERPNGKSIIGPSYTRQR